MCEQALSLFGCSPGVINPMWDQPVRVVARLRVSAEVADSLLNDGEPLHLRRIFAVALNIDVSRIEVGGYILCISFCIASVLLCVVLLYLNFMPIPLSGSV